MTWGVKEIPCEPHNCSWCGAEIDHHEVTVDGDGKELDWPHCPVCQGN